MADLLVRLVDKINPDFYLNCQCSKRGDVIAVTPDGWLWGADELSNPEWIILHSPDLPIDEALAFCVVERPLGPVIQTAKAAQTTLQKRAFKLDLTNIAVPKALQDPVVSRKQALTVPADLLRAIKIQKPPIVDPAVIGDNKGMIG